MTKRILLNSIILGIWGYLILFLVFSSSTLNSWPVIEGARILVQTLSPFAKQRTGDVCSDSPVEAYTIGIACPKKFVVKASSGNEPVLGGGCALQYAISEGRLAAFEEFLAAGADPRRCPGYPFSIYNGITEICKDKPALAHKFFAAIEQNASVKETSNALMWHSTLSKCVEGVLIALKNGASVDKPGGDVRKVSAGLALYSPLEQTLLHGRPDDYANRLAITKILIKAGASPLEVDTEGVSLFARAESAFKNTDQWAELREALERAPHRSQP